jgi:hypothetical protein
VTEAGAALFGSAGNFDWFSGDVTIWGAGTGTVGSGTILATTGGNHLAVGWYAGDTVASGAVQSGNRLLFNISAGNLLPDTAAGQTALLNAVMAYTSLGGVSPVAPANNAVNVVIDQDLSWTITNPAITNIDLYFGTVNDPNLSVPANKKLSMEPATTTTWDTGTLEHSKTYYWKVDVYEPNEAGGYFKKEGRVWSFTTAAPNAQISVVNPAFTAASGDAVLSVTGVSVSYQWYKMDVWMNSSWSKALSITTPHIDDQDVQLLMKNYYCVGSNNAPSSASNRDTGSGRHAGTSDEPLSV